MDIPKRELVVLLVSCMIQGIAAAPTVAADEKPNVIFILTDDQGWGDLACYGHPYIQTPHLDRLASEGTVFRQFYVNSPVCSASRVAFTTGQFPSRHSIFRHISGPEDNEAWRQPHWLPTSTTTVAKLLKSVGYATAHYGKWHLSGHFGQNTEPGDVMHDAPHPSAYGFDEFGTRHSRPDWNERQSPYFRARSTGIFVDEAIGFIRRHVEDPFYVQVWTLVPHAKLRPTPDELAVYEELEVESDRFRAWMRKYADAAPDLQAQAKTYFAAITGMDAALGRLFDALDQMQLTERTIIFFASDNGPADYHSGWGNSGMGSPGPFRGRKMSIYEGGIRMPCIVRWPGRSPAGRVDETTVMAGIDFLPTICRLASAELPSGFRPDGQDMSAAFSGESVDRQRPLYWEWRFQVPGFREYTPPPLAVRDGPWKLFVQPDGRNAELYNLREDPTERDNLAADHAERTRCMTRKVLAWLDTLPPGPAFPDQFTEK